MTDEEIRDAEYLESIAARLAYRRALALSLRVDDPAPYEQLLEDWQPLITFIQEMKNNDRTEERPSTTVWKRV